LRFFVKLQYLFSCAFRLPLPPSSLPPLRVRADQGHARMFGAFDVDAVADLAHSCAPPKGTVWKPRRPRTWQPESPEAKEKRPARSGEPQKLAGL
jgi:hypothetical protein